ncbi:MAG: hypothetical protein ACI9TB_002148, partial [Parasphingorhabdus sp.]
VAMSITQSKASGKISFPNKRGHVSLFGSEYLS